MRAFLRCKWATVGTDPGQCLERSLKDNKDNTEEGYQPAWQKHGHDLPQANSRDLSLRCQTREQEQGMDAAESAPDRGFVFKVSPSDIQLTPAP